jgi:hypothetical protein
MRLLRGPCLAAALIVAVAVLAGQDARQNVRAASGGATNSQTITILDSASPPTAASLYPSSINLSDLPGTITDVDLTIHGFAHSTPQNVDMLLVGPTGQAVRVMSDVGGNNGVSDVSLTIDDEAAELAPDQWLTTGRYRVTNRSDSSSDSFPAPAPSSSYASSLSAFDGTNPTGEWSLYVVDDHSGGSGQINGGWSLAIVTENPPTLDALNDRTVDEATTTTIQLSANDIDGDALTFGLDNAPSFVSLFDHGNGSGSLIVAPTYDDSGSYPGIVVSVRDGSTTVSQSFGITVNNVNRPPTSRAGADIIVNDWDGDGVETVTLDGSASFDPDNDIVRWRWRTSAGILTHGEIVTWQFATGIHDVSLVVRDAYDVDSIDTLRVEVRDVVAPTTTVELSSGATEFGWHNQPVNISLASADNPGGSGFASLTYAATGAKVIEPTTTTNPNVSVNVNANGVTTFTWQARDHAGNVESEHTIILRIDMIAPRATAPSHKYKLPLTQINETSLQVTMAWTGSDQVSGVQRYEFQESVDGGSFNPISLATPETMTRFKQLTAGRTYQYRVRSIDFAGNTSAWMTRAPFTVLDYEQADTSLTYTGAWSDAAATGSFQGTNRVTTDTTSAAVLRFQGTSVTWITSTGPDRGKADVYLNGQKILTVDLFTKIERSRRALFTRNNLNPNLTYTLEIRPIAQRHVKSTGNRIDVDEIIVLR